MEMSLRTDWREETGRRRPEQIYRQPDSRHISRRIAGSRIMYIAMERRARRKKIRKIMVALLIAAAFFTGFFGRTLFDVYAREESGGEAQRYYTSIRLKPGDNLWKIADCYAQDTGYTAAEYVEELKRMNRLTDGQIHAGEYLTIVYHESPAAE